MSHPVRRSTGRNRLALESSPYLLLHAGNPVDWYPWGEEAFEKARREDKPIFLSVGYSTCYWCHVMERESFSDAEIARQINEGFVAIKLDREERPELDELYMTATQLLTRSGGWPNSLFLTHDLKPFYAGTYFPPDDRFGRPGFPRVLAAVGEAWRLRRESVLEQAETVASAMREQLSAGAGPRLPEPGSAEATQAQLARRHDAKHGGFGGAPKFPSPANLFFLLERAEAGDAQARQMLVLTLERMAGGGIHDQLAGGFHRYSTDAEWLVPHFEKMLYDNASLAALYAAAAPLAPGLGFARVARATLDFVLAELAGPDGGFLSAIDAETDGHEGAYYTWPREELEAILDPEALRLLGLVYGFDGPPNFEGGRHVLHLPESLESRARGMELEVAELLRRLEPGRRALLEARGRRPRPLVDDKILTDWNGLMIGAMAEAGRRLPEPRYLDAGRRAASFVLGRCRAPSGALLHAFRLGRAKVPALLDDYAFLIEGLLLLERASGETKWLEEALRLQQEQDRRLADEAGGYFAAEDDTRLLLRSKPSHDGAVASGNGIAALNLLELAARTGEPAFRQRAQQVVSAFGGAIDELPLAHVTLVRAAMRLGGVPVQPRASAAHALERAEGLVEARGWLEAGGEGGWRPFVLELTIREGWHLNANPAGQPFLVPLAVSAPSGALRRVRYPPSEPLEATPATEPIPTYRGRIQVRGEIVVGSDVPVVMLAFQACDLSRCLPAVTREVALAADAPSRR